MRENYNEFKARTSKGKKEIVQAHASARGEGVNGFINQAIDNQMEQDKRTQAASDGPRKASVDAEATGKMEGGG